MSYYSLISLMPKSTGIDPDAQAFITAASITDPTQQSAINQLVVSLKGYNIWTKFKGIYPIVGGVASSHAVNLKTPGTFNLTFTSGWTHSSTGMTPTNAYANTGFNPLTHLGVNSNSLGYYSGTNLSETISDPTNMGGFISVTQAMTLVKPNTTLSSRLNGSLISYSTTTMRGFFSASRQSATLTDVYLNGSQVGTGNSGGTLPNNNVLLGTISIDSSSNPYGAGYVKNDFRFAYLSDGLDDTQMANLYTAVQAYQTTLGRSIGTQTVSDADAQAFVNAANITDQVQANAINDLVIGMKADGLWTKMKAIYPIVGGVASSHSVNLKTPGTYNLTFATGWTHSATGMTPNGSSAYANTALNPSSVLTLNSTHLSFYSRTNVSAVQRDIAVYQNADNPVMALGTNVGTEISDHYNYNQRISASIASSTGFYIGSRTSSISHKLYKNNTTLGTNTSTNTNALPNGNLFVGASNNSIVNTISSYSTKECSFASIGDGLTDAEAANLYNRVQTYQTTLNRNV